MELGYWGIKGAAEPIRWLIAFLGLPVKEYNPSSPDDWFVLKKDHMGMDFPNLPYLLDGDFKISETCAIPFYLANKAGKPELFGKDGLEQAYHKQIEGVLADLWQTYLKAISHKDNHVEEWKKCAMAGSLLKVKLDQLSKYLGTKEYLFGHITYADIALAYQIDFIEITCSSLGLEHFVKADNLIALNKRVKELPGIKTRVEQSAEIPFAPATMVPFKMLTTHEHKAKHAHHHKN